MLRRAGLLDEAHAAMDLHARGRDLDPEICRPRLDHGDEQVDAALLRGARLGIGVMARPVDGAGGVVGERAHRLGLRAHRQQHTPDVGVVDDGIGVTGGRGDRPALDALPGEVACLLIGALGDGDALEPDIEARIVHHREHALHAAVLLADEEADGAAIVAIGEHTGRARMDTELVLEADAAHVVALAELAIGIDQELWHEEERDAARARRRIGQAGQHEMDDVRGHVVLAIGDEDFLPGDAVAVAVAHGARAQCADIRARLRLGQVHRAGPFAGDELGQINLLLLLRAVRVERLDGPNIEQRAKREAHIRRVPHLEHGGGERHGQALAAMLGREGERVPAALDVFGVSLLEAVGGAHDAVLEPARLPVADAVERRQHAAGELARLFQHGVHHIRARLLAARQPRDLVDAGDLGQREAHIGEGGGIVGHGSGSSCLRRYGGRILPGFINSSGSSACLRRRMSASSSGDL